MRTSLIVFHRWLALATSILVVVVALSGSALVFEGAIDRGLNPGLWRVSAPGGAAISLDTLVAHAQAAAPSAPVSLVQLPLEPDRAYLMESGSTQLFLDPFTGRVNGIRTPRQREGSLARRLHVLHVSLMSGRGGSTLVGLVTIASFLLVVTGVIIWWRDRLWRIRWTASWKRIVFDLHHTLGIAASLILPLITASGMVMHYKVLGSAIAQLDPGADAARQVAQPGPAEGMPTISIDSVARSALGALPGARIVILSLAGAPNQPYLVGMRFPEDPVPTGRSRVLIDRYRGTVLHVESTRDAKTGAHINNLMRAVHTGDLFGKPTEGIWLVAVLVLATQAVTGVLMWWNGRRARRVLRDRR